MMQRRLNFDGIENLRDLGGYTTAHGRQTRWRSFLRANHFQAWTTQAQQALIEYGVKVVIDLRAPSELESMPNTFASSSQVTYLNLPLMPRELYIGTTFQTLINTMQDPYEMYVFMLEECKTPIGEIFTAIATHNTQTTLFHCHAGKDRTGIVAALLLSLAGVDDEVIAQEYALTGEYLSEGITRERLQAQDRGEDMNRFDLLASTPKQSMQTTLDYLRDHYTDAPTYLQTCGVSDTHLDVLRTLIVE